MGVPQTGQTRPKWAQNGAKMGSNGPQEHSRCPLLRDPQCGSECRALHCGSDSITEELATASVLAYHTCTPQTREGVCVRQVKTEEERNAW